jgi:putative membrane protein
MWDHGSGWGMMGDWGLMGGFGLIFWLVILATIIAGLVWFVRSQQGASGRYLPSEQRSASLQILEERYARGEIDREEYLQKKRDILD